MDFFELSEFFMYKLYYFQETMCKLQIKSVQKININIFFCTLVSASACCFSLSIVIFFYLQAIAKRKGKLIAMASRGKRSTTTAIAIVERVTTIERALIDKAEKIKSINFIKSNREKSNSAIALL